MPLVRFEVKSEHGLGHPELYREVDREDPKAVLDGVAVAGLVGILRQLGDLAEFAAEIFHGIQEEVMSTASRSHKLMTRVQQIEAGVPALEKAVFAQTSHLHFAYTAGSEWHPRIPNEQNHFIYNDLPRFVMDSYGECRDPPGLHLLDKFDTGGPGSCLKRYSDPTFFRKASDGPSAANNVIQKDKKNYKIKKKRSLQRNHDISPSASMSDKSSRRQFIPLSFSGRTSSFRTSATAGMAFRSDLQDRSKSFDCRSGSGYTESLYSLSSLAKPEEKEPKESSSSRLTRHADTPSSVLSDGRSEAVEDDFPYRPPQQEQAARGSSSVSWDEKAEIVESYRQQSFRDEVPEIIDMNFGPDASNREVANVSSIDRRGFLSDYIHTTEPIRSMNQLNEIDIGLELEEADIETEKIEDEPKIDHISDILCEPENESEQETESEGENYVDAPNTIESESENDIEYRIKQEAKQFYEAKGNRIDNAVHEHDYDQSYPTKEEVEQNSTNVEEGKIEDEAHERMSSSPDHGEFAHCASNTYEIITCSLPDALSSENISDGQKPQVSGRSSDLNLSPGTDVCANGNSYNILREESLVKVRSLSSPGASISDSSNPLCINGIQEPQESQAETSLGGQPVKIWTNGSLLGLEPSKPPVFSGIRDNTKVEDGMDDPPNGQKERSDKFIENAQQLQSSTIEKASEPFADERALTKTSMVPPGNELSVESDVNDILNGTHNESNETSSGVFGISHRILMNGFHRKESFTHNNKSVPASIPETAEVTERKVPYDQAIQETTFKDPFENEAPFNWFTSSPPLEHMKISFNPADGLQSSKLKLKYPDGIKTRESNTDAFPSFQLVPVRAISSTGTDSDDDTFCRSSPYMSNDDDHLSYNHSESDSLLWEESGESPERKDQELYDALHRNMHMENVAEPSLSSPLLDVPSFDAFKPSLQTETLDSSVSQNLLNLQNPLEPTPPPLPPIEWRVSRIPSDRFEDKRQTLQNALRHAFSQKVSLSAGSERSQVASVNKESNLVPAARKPENKEDSKENMKGEDMDKSDFLHQIRTKQFNLRRTAATRPSAATVVTTNVNINAILEKANAIRQAVASDDGEETDTWSDA